MIVVDTNVLAYLVLHGEKSAPAEVAFRRDPHWVAPLLWRSEFMSVLALYLRKGLLDQQAAVAVMTQAEHLLQTEYRVAPANILSLVAASTCSAYDCEFAALARELDARLLTEDRLVLGQFPGLAISLADFLAQPS
jgi:predicted nucleic acid-binding protein